MTDQSKKARHADSAFTARVSQSFSKDQSPDPVPGLEKMIADFKQDLSAHPLLDKSSDVPPTYSDWFRRPLLDKSSDVRPAHRRWFRSFPRLLALGSGLAGLVIILLSVFVNLTPTWADIEKQFGILNGFSLSIYHRNHIDQRPAFARLWSDKSGRTRIHTGSQVIFLDQYGDIQSFDVEARLKGKSFSLIFIPIRAIQRANRRGMITLGALIDALAGENMIDTTGLVISNSHVAKDLLVFDAGSRDTLWGLRVWALKESKLPVRILKWHRTDGRFIDLQFTYSKALPERFFDPETFSADLDNPLISRYELLSRYLQETGETGSSVSGH